MASKRFLLAVSAIVALTAMGCGEKVVKAGVPPPEKRQPGDPSSNRPPDRQGARGGLGMPKELPKGPY